MVVSGSSASGRSLAASRRYRTAWPFANNQVDALFDELERRGVFDQLWGSPVRGHREENIEGWTTRREMFDLMRDRGFAFGQSYGMVTDDEDRGVWTRLLSPSESL